MTLLAMILANERNLSEASEVNNWEELKINFEKYRTSWLKHKEQANGGTWLTVYDGVLGSESTVFGDEKIDILDKGGSLSSVSNNERVANVDLLQFQKDLKNGTTGNAPEIKFRGNKGAGGSALAYINFNST